MAAVQAICDGLGEVKIDAAGAQAGCRILPHPFTADDTAAGYRYELSVLQAEFSLTQVLDAPVTGRIFFDQLIRDNLDIGRPDRVSLVFGRKIVRKGSHPTPGRFRTRVITDGVTPSLHVATRTPNQAVPQAGQGAPDGNHHQRHPRLRRGQGAVSSPELKEIGFTASRRLLDAQRSATTPPNGAAALAALTSPVISPAGTRTAGMRFGDLRAHALLAALCALPAAAPRFHQPRPAHLLAPLLG